MGFIVRCFERPLSLSPLSFARACVPVSLQFGETTPVGEFIPGGLFLKGHLNLLGFHLWAEIIINPKSRILIDVSW